MSPYEGAYKAYICLKLIIHKIDLRHTKSFIMQISHRCNLSLTSAIAEGIKYSNRHGESFQLKVAAINGLLHSICFQLTKRDRSMKLMKNNILISVAMLSALSNHAYALDNIPGMPGPQPLLPNYTNPQLLGNWDMNGDGIIDTVDLTYHWSGSELLADSILIHHNNGQDPGVYGKPGGFVHGIWVGQMNQWKGQEMVVSSLNTNTGEEYVSFIRDASGAEDSAQLIAGTPQAAGLLQTDGATGLDFAVFFQTWNTNTQKYTSGVSIYNANTASRRDYLWKTNGDRLWTYITFFKSTAKPGAYRIDMHLNNGHTYQIRDWSRTMTYQ